MGKINESLPVSSYWEKLKREILKKPVLHATSIPHHKIIFTPEDLKENDSSVLQTKYRIPFMVIFYILFL